jgi:hypothetical protein
MPNEEHLARLKQGFVDVLATMRYALTSGAASVYAEVRTWIAKRQGGRAYATLVSESWPACASPPGRNSLVGINGFSWHSVHCCSC